MLPKAPLPLFCWLPCFLLLWLQLTPAAAREAAVRAPAPFPLEVNGRPLHYGVNFEPVMPGQEVIFSTGSPLISRLRIEVAGIPVAGAQQHFKWRAPTKAGVYRAQISLLAGGREAVQHTLAVNLLVMVPANRVSNGYLNGYRIGRYPPALRDLDAYQAPRGFIEVTEKNRHTALSPNFTLGQFLCKQQSGFPKYLVLQPALLNKLEEFLLEVNERGIVTPSFVVMSGYRTPHYNQVIKNVRNSYHLYGGAADIYIDVNDDGVMDDLNKDGKTDRRDAAYLYQLADSFAERHNRPDLTGGVGEYDSTAAHGPFIHVDVRGTPARWGH